MSTSNNTINNAKCGKCKKFLRKIAGPRKDIRTPEEALAFGVAVGDCICFKCRKNPTRSKPIQELRPPLNVVMTRAQSQPSTSGLQRENPMNQLSSNRPTPAQNVDIVDVPFSQQSLSSILTTSTSSYSQTSTDDPTFLIPAENEVVELQLVSWIFDVREHERA